MARQLFRQDDVLHQRHAVKAADRFIALAIDEHRLVSASFEEWKRNAGVMMGVSAATYLGAVAMQGIRLAGMAQCINKTS